LRAGKYLYIQAPRRELYDDAADPKAAHNLASASPAVADTLATRLKDFQHQTTTTQPTPEALMDAAKTQKLAALGYIGSRNEASLSPSTEQGADPKDKIRTVNILVRINSLLENHHCDQAMPELRKAIHASPDISMLHFFLGGCYTEKKDYEKAVPELREAVRLDPAFIHGQTNLGRALMQIQDFSGAAEVFERVAKMQPNLMDAHVFLEVVYARLNRVQDEITECRLVLKVEPEHYGSNLNLGRFLAQSGDLEGAIPSLQKAASIRPSVPVPHIYLADVYEKLGRNDDAARERAEAERLGAVSRDSLIPPNSAPDTTDKH
jgi:tetratricopeptide (TPR) repeat protein